MQQIDAPGRPVGIPLSHFCPDRIGIVLEGRPPLKAVLSKPTWCWWDISRHRSSCTWWWGWRDRLATGTSQRVVKVKPGQAILCVPQWDLSAQAQNSTSPIPPNQLAHVFKSQGSSPYGGRKKNLYTLQKPREEKLKRLSRVLQLCGALHLPLQSAEVQ